MSIFNSLKHMYCNWYGQSYGNWHHFFILCQIGAFQHPQVMLQLSNDIILSFNTIFVIDYHIVQNKTCENDVWYHIHAPMAARVANNRETGLQHTITCLNIFAHGLLSFCKITMFLIMWLNNALHKARLLGIYTVLWENNTDHIDTH